MISCMTSGKPVKLGPKSHDSHLPRLPTSRLNVCNHGEGQGPHGHLARRMVGTPYILRWDMLHTINNYNIYTKQN